MNKKFLPKTYKQKLYDRLHSLKQDKRSVAEYIREFDEVKLRCDIPEAKENIIARFISGLNRELSNVVELQQFKTLDDVHKLALKVEEQRAKSLSSRGYSRADFGYKKVTFEGKAEPTKVMGLEKDKGKVEASKPSGGPKTFVPRGDGSKGRCFKCHGVGHFQSNCPNMRVMSLREWEEAGECYQTEETLEESTEEFEELDVEADDGELLVIRRSLISKPSLGEEQRENIFQTRCTIGGKVCAVIVDSGSCTNVASTTLVEKLGLPTTPHPSPYKL